MSFTYSGGTLTQTGTDTSLAGLSGLTGVTHYNGPYFDNYTIDASTELVISGTVTIDTRLEQLVCQRTPGYCPPDSQGVMHGF